MPGLDPDLLRAYYIVIELPLPSLALSPSMPTGSLAHSARKSLISISILLGGRARQPLLFYSKAGALE